MSCNLRTSLLKCINSVLAAKDVAVLHDVFLIIRHWSGEQIGDGKCREQKYKINPSPVIRNFSHDIRAESGGAIQQGDILLTSISGLNYNRDFLGPQVDDPRIEKFYVIDDQEYRIVNIVEHLVTWDVLVRQTIANKRT